MLNDLMIRGREKIRFMILKMFEGSNRADIYRAILGGKAFYKEGPGLLKALEFIEMLLEFR